MTLQATIATWYKTSTDLKNSFILDEFLNKYETDYQTNDSISSLIDKFVQQDIELNNEIGDAYVYVSGSPNDDYKVDAETVNNAVNKAIELFQQGDLQVEMLETVLRACEVEPKIVNNGKIINVSFDYNGDFYTTKCSVESESSVENTEDMIFSKNEICLRYNISSIEFEALINSGVVQAATSKNGVVESYKLLSRNEILGKETTTDPGFKIALKKDEVAEYILSGMTNELLTKQLIELYQEKNKTTDIPDFLDKNINVTSLIETSRLRQESEYNNELYKKIIKDYAGQLYYDITLTTYYKDEYKKVDSSYTQWNSRFNGAYIPFQQAEKYELTISPTTSKDYYPPLSKNLNMFAGICTASEFEKMSKEGYYFRIPDFKNVDELVKYMNSAGAKVTREEIEKSYPVEYSLEEVYANLLNSAETVSKDVDKLNKLLTDEGISEDTLKAINVSSFAEKIYENNKENENETKIDLSIFAKSLASTIKNIESKTEDELKQMLGSKYNALTGKNLSSENLNDINAKNLIYFILRNNEITSSEIDFNEIIGKSSIAVRESNGLQNSLNQDALNCIKDLTDLMFISFIQDCNAMSEPISAETLKDYINKSVSTPTATKVLTGMFGNVDVAEKTMYGIIEKSLSKLFDGKVSNFGSSFEKGIDAETFKSSLPQISNSTTSGPNKTRSYIKGNDGGKKPYVNPYTDNDFNRAIVAFDNNNAKISHEAANISKEYFSEWERIQKEGTWFEKLFTADAMLQISMSQAIISNLTSISVKETVTDFYEMTGTTTYSAIMFAASAYDPTGTLNGADFVIQATSIGWNLSTNESYGEMFYELGLTEHQAPIAMAAIEGGIALFSLLPLSDGAAKELKAAMKTAKGKEILKAIFTDDIFKKIINDRELFILLGTEGFTEAFAKMIKKYPECLQFFATALKNLVNLVVVGGGEDSENVDSAGASSTPITGSSSQSTKSDYTPTAPPPPLNNTEIQQLARFIEYISEINEKPKGSIESTEVQALQEQIKDAYDQLESLKLSLERLDEQEKEAKELHESMFGSLDGYSNYMITQEREMILRDISLIELTIQTLSIELDMAIIRENIANNSDITLDEVVIIEKVVTRDEILDACLRSGFSYEKLKLLGLDISGNNCPFATYMDNANEILKYCIDYYRDN